jgi:predicted alpha-1,2-mannosidase
MSRSPIALAIALLLVLGLVPAAGAAPSSAVPEEDLARWVDPMIGTFAPGFIFPGAVRPFGMVQNSPDTEGQFAYGGYLYSDATIRGFSLVHISGPGVKKGGDLPFMPTVGPVTSSSAHDYASPWDRVTETAEAGYYRVQLVKGPQVELTATDRVGLQRYTFPPGQDSNVLIDVGRTAKQNHLGPTTGEQMAGIEIIGDDEVSGWTRGRYPVYFVARFDRPFTAYGTWQGTELAPGSAAQEGVGTGGWVTFDTTDEREVTATIGISFVDLEGARRNLEAEAADFDDVRADARTAWNDALASIRVEGGTPLEHTSFYTALYRSLIHPNVFTDVDGRYRGMDDSVHHAGDRTHYANFASWDTYKGHNQLMATLFGERYRDMVLSQLDNARTQGRIPRFGEHSYDASHMSGDPAIPMLVDGYCRGVLDDIDPGEVDDLYRYMTELATLHRNPALAELGWLPDRPGTTLEYGVADFALALMADALGHDEDAQRWLEQSLNYRNILDPQTRWIRPRAADGTWHSPFFPEDETGFQEGNSWQYSWLAPHDARGLYDRMGGDEVAVERLDTLFAQPLSATVPFAPAEVQKWLNVFGLVYRTPTYAPGNEHDLQVPWMYPFAGEPWKTQAVHRQIQGLFRPTLDGLPGNDDLGGLSAWFVWSALGFGPVTPGAPFHVVGSPVFERAELRLPGHDRSFVLVAPGASQLGKYVQSAHIDGRPLEESWFLHDVIASGRTLHLEMGVRPNLAWATGPESRPPSVSDAPLSSFGCRP